MTRALRRPAVSVALLAAILGLASTATGSFGVSSTIATGKHPSGVVVGAGSLWVTNDVDNTVSQIDLATHTLTRTIALHGRAFPDPAFAAFDGSAVWVVARTTGTVSRIDARTGRVTATGAVPGLALGIAVAGTSAWVPSFDPDRCSNNSCFSRLTQLDARTAKVIGRYVVDSPAGIAFGYGSLWIVDHRSARVSRFDPERGRVVATISVRLGHEGIFEGPEQVATGVGGVWVSHPQGVVSRIDPASNRVVARVRFPRDAGPSRLAIGAGSVWAVGPKRIFRIDPATNRIVASAPVGKHGGADSRGLRSIAVTGGAAWVTDGDADTVDLITLAHRGGRR